MIDSSWGWFLQAICGHIGDRDVFFGCQNKNYLEVVHTINMMKTPFIIHLGHSQQIWTGQVYIYILILVGGVHDTLFTIPNLVGCRVLPAAGHHSVACDFGGRHLEFMIAKVMENSIVCPCSLLMAVIAWFLLGSNNWLSILPEFGFV
jgi:hypothetical protein